MAESGKYRVQSDTPSSDKMPDYSSYPNDKIEPDKQRYPCCIVWTPIPLLTWLMPIFGHMGICTTTGIIRDFAGPYCVMEDNMAFGAPTKYWQLSLDEIPGNNGRDVWDRSVYDASEIYKCRMHNLCCDNCHSHVALALNQMNYSGRSNWNMVNVVAAFMYHSKYVSVCCWIKTWLPFLCLICLVIIIAIAVRA